MIVGLVDLIAVMNSDFDLHDAGQFILFFGGLGVFFAFLVIGVVIVFVGIQERGFHLCIRLPVTGAAQRGWVTPALPVTNDQGRLEGFVAEIRRQRRVAGNGTEAGC